MDTQIITKDFQIKKHPGSQGTLDELFNSGNYQSALRAKGSLFSNAIGNHVAMSFDDSFYRSHNSGAMIATGSSFEKSIGAKVCRATEHTLVDSQGAIVYEAQDDALLRARDATVTGTLFDRAGTDGEFNYIGKIEGEHRRLSVKHVGSEGLRGRINGWAATLLGSTAAKDVGLVTVKDVSLMAYDAGKKAKEGVGSLIDQYIRR